MDAVKVETSPGCNVNNVNANTTTNVYGEYLAKRAAVYKTAAVRSGRANLWSVFLPVFSVFWLVFGSSVSAISVCLQRNTNPRPSHAELKFSVRHIPTLLSFLLF